MYEIQKNITVVVNRFESFTFVDHELPSGRAMPGGLERPLDLIYSTARRVRPTPHSVHTHTSHMHQYITPHHPSSICRTDTAGLTHVLGL